MEKSAFPVGTLEGRHVVLELLDRSHVDGLLSIGADAELWRYSPTVVNTPEDLRRYLAGALAERDRGESAPFAVRLRKSGGLAGSTRFGNYVPRHRRVEIGWTWIGRAYQRTVVNTESKILMLEAAFNQLGCHRVEFKTDSLNEASQRAIERLGATREGLFRSHMIAESGRVRDTVYYSILLSEWPAARERLLRRSGLDSFPTI